MWSIANFVIGHELDGEEFLSTLFSLPQEEKAFFTTPNDSPFYRIFLYLTKNNRSFFIDSLKSCSKDEIFNALYLRNEFLGSKELWSLKELYDLSLLEPSILEGSLLTFDGQKDVQTIAKIALSDHIHKFCTFFLEGHQNIIWDIVLEMAKRGTSDYENSSMWSIANFVIGHELDGEEFLSTLFSLPQEEKSFFTNPNDSPFYRIFLYLTKNNRSFFIDSLKSCSKDEIFNALYLRNDFLGSKEMWNLKELYDLSLLEPSVLAGHLLKFDGKEDIQILSKISLNKVSYHFFPYLITMGYSDMALVLMIKSMTTLPKDHSILWSLVSLAIKKNLRTKESLQAIYALDKPLRTRFLTPSRSATFTFFIYLKEETDRDLTAYLKGLSRNDYFTCLTLRKSIIEKNRTHQQYL